MRGFPGFREGLSRHTPLPESFFSDLLPLIDDLAELQLILFCCRALAQKDAPLRYLQASELEADEHLLLALRQADAGAGAGRYPASGPGSRDPASRPAGGDFRGQ